MTRLRLAMLIATIALSSPAHAELFAVPLPQGGLPGRLSAELQVAEDNQMNFVGLTLDGWPVLDVQNGAPPAGSRGPLQRGQVTIIDQLIVHYADGFNPINIPPSFKVTGDAANLKFLTVQSEPQPGAGPGFAPGQLTALEQVPNVVRVEADAVFRAMGALGPSSEPLLDVQWSLFDMHAIDAWSTVSTSPIVVAVIDTGVDNGKIVAHPHEDLHEPRIHRDYIKYGGAAADAHGHGTALAGIIGARGDNSHGMSGVLWSVPMLNLRALDASAHGQASALAQAMHDAIEAGKAKIICAAWAGPTPSKAIEDQILYARGQGTVIVAAAGNEGRDLDAVVNGALSYRLYPACYSYDNILSVLAVADTDDDDVSDARWPRSNWGAKAVDIGAPGLEVLSPVRRAGFGISTGSSAATANAVGALALVWGTMPDAGYKEVLGELIAMARPLSALDEQCKTAAVIDLAAIGSSTPVTPPGGGFDAIGILAVPVVAVGGETTGMTLAVGRETFEVQIDDPVLKRTASTLDGQPVRVAGRVSTRVSVERGRRRIVVVESLQLAGP